MTDEREIFVKRSSIGTIIALLAGAVIMMAAAEGIGKSQVVGGPCEYESQPGICHITDVKGSALTLFTFTGKVDGRDVKLKKNETRGSFKAGSEIACSIEFITKGTCTPCGFDLNGVWGSCGKAAWEFFRNR